MVQYIDIGPKVLVGAGIKQPENMPEQSFIPILTGDASIKPRQEIFYEYYLEYDFPMTPQFSECVATSVSISIIRVFGTEMNCTTLKMTRRNV